jgi:hypothetical protein
MRRRTNIYLDDEQCVALDARAEAEGVSRAELIRRYLDEALGRGQSDLEHDLAAIDAAFGIWADRDDIDIPSRAPGEREADLERRWRR